MVKIKLNSSLFDDSELLKYALENGMIDLDAIRNDKEMNERREILSRHPYSIWQAPDGYWKTYILDEKTGKRVQKRRKNKRDIEDLVISTITPQIEETYTIEKAFNEWNDRNLELGKISQSTHLRNRNVYQRHYMEFGQRELSSVTAEEFEDFLEYEVCSKKLKTKAYSNLKGITRGFLKRAKKQRYIDFHVEEMLDDVNINARDFQRVYKDDSEEVFSDGECNLIIEYLSQHIDTYNLAILLMFATGCRIGEIVTLQYDDFQNENGIIVIQISKTETFYKDSDGNYVIEVKQSPKTPAGYRRVIIPRQYHWIYKEMRKHNPFGEYAFIQYGERAKAQAIRNRLRRICKKLGIKNKSPHKIRKTYASILLDNGVDENFIIKQMGHTSISCTENFYHRDRKSLESKQRILDSIPEFKAL